MIVLYKGNTESWGGVYSHVFRILETVRDRVTMICDPNPAFTVGLDAEVLIPTSVKVGETVISQMQSLRLIQQAGAGLEGIDRDAARARRIHVANVPTDVSGAARAVAEHALGLMLAVLRGHRGFPVAIAERKLGYPVGSSLFGKTVGIIGFGSIGRQIAKLLGPFEVSVLALSRTGTRDTAFGHVRWVRPSTDLRHLLRESDIVVLACTLSSATYRILDREALRDCKPGVCIINVARGPLLDPEAALEALCNGHIAGLGIDVFEDEPVNPVDPLILHPRTISSPHVAAATEEVARTVASIVADNIMRLLEDRPPNFEALP